MISTKLKKEHYDCKTQLEALPEYYECPVCLSLKEKMLECPSCKARSCKDCLEDFSKAEHSKNPQFKQDGIYKCTICLKVNKQMNMHRFLFELLQDLKFRCNDCKFSMEFKIIKTHKQMGQCQISKGDLDVEQAIAIQPNAFQGGKSFIKSLFVCERDTKNVYEYILQTKQTVKKMLTMTSSFPHNFQSVQTLNGKVFVIGGGDFSKVPETMFECNEIDFDNSTLIPRDRLKYPRHGHSACALGEKFIFVTGSRKENENAHVKCECYNADIDLWFEVAQLNEGRHYHASCSFLDRFVYIFCGISNSSKKYINSIEKFDNLTKKSWELINVPIDSFAARQGLGVAQMNQDEIMIFGGFNGKFMKDAHILKASTKMLRPAEVQPTMEIFLFQMPTVFEQSTGSIYTVDWQKMKIIQYRGSHWNVVDDLKKI